MRTMLILAAFARHLTYELMELIFVNHRASPPF
jgi:hypothetical protein